MEVAMHRIVKVVTKVDHYHFERSDVHMPFATMTTTYTDNKGVETVVKAYAYDLSLFPNPDVIHNNC